MLKLKKSYDYFLNLKGFSIEAKFKLYHEFSPRSSGKNLPRLKTRYFVSKETELEDHFVGHIN